MMSVTVIAGESTGIMPRCCSGVALVRHELAECGSVPNPPSVAGGRSAGLAGNRRSWRLVNKISESELHHQKQLNWKLVEAALET